MKALKNDSTAYTQSIVSAITACYEATTEPSNAELLTLYSTIGQCICEQGEKAFVVHLAQALAEQLPQIKGFSPRNLRRMRDLYRTYENQPELMRKAQTLGWTQNTVILDCCETDEQRVFYIALAVEKKLSKLALMKAIEAGEFEAAQAEESAAGACPACCPVVGEIATEEAVDTTIAVKTARGAFVPACEPPRQESGLPDDKSQHKISFCGDTIGKQPKPVNSNAQQKRSSHPTPKRSMELLPFGIDYLIEACRLLNGKPPPHRWRDFRMHEQGKVIA